MVVRHAARSWIYLQTAPDKFTRREITPDRPAEQGWFITSGLKESDRAVVSGAQLLLSEELKSQMKGEE